MPDPNAASAPFRRWSRCASLWIPVAVLVSALTILAVFRSEAQTGDSLEYARAVRSGSALFHPHHLLFNPIVRLAWIGIKVFFPEAGPIDAAQAHNILWALVVLAAVFRIVLRMTDSTAAAVVAALGLFSLVGFWQYATFVEIYIPTMGCLALILALLLGSRNRPISPGLQSAIAALFVLAVLYDQLSVFFAVPMAVLSAERLGNKGRLKACGWIAGAGLAVSAVYLAAYLSTEGPKTVGGIVHWFLSYAYHPDPSWGSWSNVTPLGAGKILLGFARNVTSIPRTLFIPAVALSGLFLAGVVLGSLRAVVRRAADSNLRLALLLWIGITGAFVWWFSPSGYELLIPILLPLFLLAVRLIADGWAAAANPRSARRTTLGAAAAAVAALFTLNLITVVLPAHAARGDAYDRAVLLQRAAPAEAVVVADYFLRENLRYYFDRPGTLENNVILFSFYRNLDLPPEYILAEDLPILVPVSFVIPESETAKPYNGHTHPREWRSFMEWLLGCEIREGKAVQARSVAKIEALPGYLLLGGDRRPVDGLADVFRRLDEAAGGSAVNPSGPFSAWLARHPDQGR